MSDKDHLVHEREGLLAQIVKNSCHITSIVDKNSGEAVELLRHDKSIKLSNNISQLDYLPKNNQGIYSLYEKIPMDQVIKLVKNCSLEDLPKLYYDILRLTNQTISLNSTTESRQFNLDINTIYGLINQRVKQEIINNSGHLTIMIGRLLTLSTDLTWLFEPENLEILKNLLISADAVKNGAYCVKYLFSSIIDKNIFESEQDMLIYYNPSPKQKVVFENLSKDLIIKILTSTYDGSKKSQDRENIAVKLFTFVLDKKEILEQLSDEEFKKTCCLENYFQENIYLDKYSENKLDNNYKHDFYLSRLIDMMLSNEYLFLNIYYNILSSEDRKFICDSSLSEYYVLAIPVKDKEEYKEILNEKMQEYINKYIKAPLSLKNMIIKSNILQMKKNPLVLLE